MFIDHVALMLVDLVIAMVLVTLYFVKAITGYASYWGHLESFSKWKPTP